MGITELSKQDLIDYRIAYDLIKPLVTSSFG